jgi:hypothetical protein
MTEARGSRSCDVAVISGRSGERAAAEAIEP